MELDSLVLIGVGEEVVSGVEVVEVGDGVVEVDEVVGGVDVLEVVVWLVVLLLVDVSTVGVAEVGVSAGVALVSLALVVVSAALAPAFVVTGVEPASPALFTIAVDMLTAEFFFG